MATEILTKVDMEIRTDAQRVGDQWVAMLMFGLFPERQQAETFAKYAREFFMQNLDKEPKTSIFSPKGNA